MHAASNDPRDPETTDDTTPNPPTDQPAAAAQPEAESADQTAATPPEGESASGESAEASRVPRPRVRLETSEGSMVIEMLEDVAPKTVTHFLQLVHDGFYDGRTFHRIVPHFIIQGGCPYADGSGGCGYTIDPEFNDTPHEKGTVSMARTKDPYSASSQFFICLERENCEHLDGEYTAFGKVVEGLDTLDRLAEVPLINYELGMPADAPMILQLYREDDPHAYYHQHHNEPPKQDSPSPDSSES